MAHTLEDARANLVGWVTYWLRTNRKGIRTAEALAARMGVSKSTLTPFFEPGGKRVPHLKNLIAIHNITEIPIDILLWSPPPPLPPVED